MFAKHKTSSNKLIWNFSQAMPARVVRKLPGVVYLDQSVKGIEQQNKRQRLAELNEMR